MAAKCDQPGHQIDDISSEFPWPAALSFSLETSSLHKMSNQASSASILAQDISEVGINIMPNVCRISASEAAQMDPQQRLLLEAAAEVMLGTHAASNGPTSGQQVATYIGISWTEYAAIATAHGLPTGAFTAQSAVLSVSVGKLGFHWSKKPEPCAAFTRHLL